MSQTDIKAEIIGREDTSITFGVTAGSEVIGEIDVEEYDKEAFVSGVSRGETINNGLLDPAQFAVANCFMQDRFERNLPLIRLFDIEDRLLVDPPT